MTEVELRLVANHNNAVKSVRELATESKKLYDNNEKQQKRQVGLIADIEKELERLGKAQKNAMSVEQLTKYNQKIAEAKQAIKEYEQEGLKVEKTGGNFLSSMGKWALGFASVAVAVKGFKAVMESTEATSLAFHSTLNGLKTGLDYLLKSIATADFSNFTTGLKNAIRAGKD
jgi:hypothetical protein